MSTADVSRFAKSRVGNGTSHFIQKLDGRSVRARRWREIHASFADQLNDELHELPQSKRHLLSALTDCALQLELARCQIVDAQPCAPETIVKLTRLYVRLLAKLGLESDE